MPERMLSVEDARAQILAPLRPLASEIVSLGEACGRVLATTVAARRASPPAAVSAMDGYAVAAASVASVPIELAVSQTIAAGQPARPLAPGTAARIFTGACLPNGADSVVVQEDTDAVGPARVRFKATISEGQHVRRAGSDFLAGAAGLREGRTLTPRDIGLAAAMNHSALSVGRKPRVAILATGDELAPPGSDPAPHQIIASSAPALAAALRLWGADPIDLGIARDDEAAIAGAIAGAREADLVLTLGGASVGDHDLVQRALARIGFQLSFWRVAMKPGKPLLHGRLGEQPLLGLPGNPVSTMVCALLFVRPAIRTMLGCRDAAGAPDIDPPGKTAILANSLSANGPRADYLRGSLRSDVDGLPVAEVFDRQDSAHQRLLAAAGCLIPRTPFAPASKAGEPHTIIPLSGLF